MTIPDTHSEHPHDHRDFQQFTTLLEARAKKLFARAQAKYGELATSAGGDPERDVFDYCLNEMAGLPRYADMIEWRVNNANLPDGVTRRAEMLCKWIRDEALWYGACLERFRAELLDIYGVDLGKPEKL